MKLVEVDQEGPPAIEAEAPRPTPPVPEHRRVAVSLLFTTAILVGTVVAIYLAFPARHNVVVTRAVAEHRAAPTWQIERPSAGDLRVWALGVLGERAPVPEPGPDREVVGARPLEILKRRTAMIRYRIGGAEVDVLIQRGHDVPPRRVSRRDGEDRVEAWRHGPWMFVAVGPAASAAGWKKALGVP
jgi:hypothetical protein